jgi:protein-S-isoprenylcysteine O-methyltransferase Ste14
MVRVMKNRFLRQASREYNPKQRLIALLCMVPIFLVVIPFLLVRLGGKLDQWLGWDFLLTEPANWLVGWSLILIGWMFGIWSNYSQFTIGRGTPVPLMATQQLIIQPPYTYCRNPMALGAIVLYLGVGVLFKSYGAMILVLLLAVCLLVYIKYVEEKEMELRFGQEYQTYRQQTPFIIPHFWKRSTDR